MLNADIQKTGNGQAKHQGDSPSDPWLPTPGGADLIVSDQEYGASGASFYDGGFSLTNVAPQPPY